VVIFAEAEAHRQVGRYADFLEQGGIETVGDEHPDLHVSIGTEDIGVVGAIVAGHIAPKEVGRILDKVGAASMSCRELFDRAGVTRGLTRKHEYDRVARHCNPIRRRQAINSRFVMRGGTRLHGYARLRRR
jgi:hypothetical protein